MSSKRRHFSAEQKAQVVRRHLAGKEAVSNLADELQIQPSMIHLWVKQVLEQVERAFDKAPGRRALAEASTRNPMANWNVGTRVSRPRRSARSARPISRRCCDA